MEETFWNRTNRLIKERGFTQDTLSVKCEFNDSRRVQNLSGAERMPKADEAVKIAQVLGVSVEYLVTGIPPKDTSPEIYELVQKIENLLPDNKDDIMYYMDRVKLRDEKDRELMEKYSIPTTFIPVPEETEKAIDKEGKKFIKKRLKRGLSDI